MAAGSPSDVAVEAKAFDACRALSKDMADFELCIALLTFDIRDEPTSTTNNETKWVMIGCRWEPPARTVSRDPLPNGTCSNTPATSPMHIRYKPVHTSPEYVSDKARNKAWSYSPSLTSSSISFRELLRFSL